VASEFRQRRSSSRVFQETTATATGKPSNRTGRQYGGLMSASPDSAPVRVLALGSVYPPHHLGGYEVIWQAVMRHLRDRGHACRVLATCYRAPGVAADDEEDPDVYRELDWYWRDHEWRELNARQTLSLERRNAQIFDRHVREFRPDVVSWWPVGGMSLGLIERARRAGLPGVLFVLDYWFSYGPQRDLWQRQWSRLRPLAPAAERLTGLPTRVRWRHAGNWVFCSETARQNVRGAGLRRARSTVLTPGVASMFTAAPVEPQPPPWRWRLLYVGRVVEPKGVHTAVEALARLPAGAELHIVGPGDQPYRERLRRRAEQLGLSARVQLEPGRPRDQLIDTYRSADVVVFPVEWPEPWGLVPLEAMALGRPVVATGRGGSGEYLAADRNCLMFDAGDADGLAAAVRRLAGDTSLRQRLKAGGRETATRHTEAAYNERAAAEILRVARGRSAG
jgi:glycogen synthase